MLKWWRLFCEHLISRSGHCVGVSRQDLGVVSRGARPALTRGQACCFINGPIALRPHSRLHRREIVSFVLICRVKTHGVQGMRQGRRHKHRMSLPGVLGEVPRSGLRRRTRAQPPSAADSPHQCAPATQPRRRVNCGCISFHANAFEYEQTSRALATQKYSRPGALLESKMTSTRSPET